MNTVLITGTTSGLGKALLIHYAAQGKKVIAINRRKMHELMDWEIEEHVLDISDYDEVFQLLKSLKGANQIPDLFILNAGINRPDNLSGLDFQIFSEIIRTNLMGAMTFVGAIKELGITGKKISTISSTSNIIPNPGHLGYYLSKLSLHESIKLLNKNDSHNLYQSVILSPVHTNIMVGSPKLKGIQSKIFDALAVNADTAAQALARFFGSNRKVFYYTKLGCLFYFAVHCLLKFIPALYRGTGAKDSDPWTTVNPKVRV